MKTPLWIKKIRSFFLLRTTQALAFVLGARVPPIISVAAYIEKDDKLLFIDHSYMKGYGFPGGIVETGESLEEALHREVFEETGLRVVTEQYVTSTYAFFRGIGIVTAFFAVTTEGSLSSSEEGEAVWEDPHKVEPYLFYETARKGVVEYLKN